MTTRKNNHVIYRIVIRIFRFIISLRDLELRKPSLFLIGELMRNSDKSGKILFKYFYIDEKYYCRGCKYYKKQCVLRRIVRVCRKKRLKNVPNNKD